MRDKSGVAWDRRKPENMGALRRRGLIERKITAANSVGLFWSLFFWDIEPR
jgi:hypothetical protein